MPCGVSGGVNPQGQTRLPTDGESERRVQSERRSHSCLRDQTVSSGQTQTQAAPRPLPAAARPRGGVCPQGDGRAGGQGRSTSPQTQTPSSLPRAPAPAPGWAGRPRVSGLRSRSRAPGRRQRAGALSGGCTTARDPANRRLRSPLRWRL